MHTFFLRRNEAKWWNTSGSWIAKFTLQPATKVLLLQVEVKVKEEGEILEDATVHIQTLLSINSGSQCHFIIV